MQKRIKIFCPSYYDHLLKSLWPVEKLGLESSRVLLFVFQNCVFILTQPHLIPTLDSASASKYTGEKIAFFQNHILFDSFNVEDDFLRVFILFLNCSFTPSQLIAVSEVTAAVTVHFLQFFTWLTSWRYPRLKWVTYPWPESGVFFLWTNGKIMDLKYKVTRQLSTYQFVGLSGCLSCDGCLSFNWRPLVNLYWPWEFILNLLLASQVKSLTTYTQFWCRSVGFHYLSKRVGHGHVNVKPKNPITDTHWYTVHSETLTRYWLKALLYRFQYVLNIICCFTNCITHLMVKKLDERTASDHWTGPNWKR